MEEDGVDPDDGAAAENRVCLPLLADDPLLGGDRYELLLVGGG